MSTEPQPHFQLVHEPTSAWGVVPTSDVVILKERDLDCDLPTAVARVRAAPETARSRILFVAAEEGADAAAEVDSAASTELAAVLPVPRAPTTPHQLARRGDALALSQLGARLMPLVGCLQRFLGESRDTLNDLDLRLRAGESQAAGDRVQMLRDVAAWVSEVVGDLETETRAAADGFQPLATRELIQEMAGQVEAQFPRLRITVGPDLGLPPCWGRAGDLAEAFFLGLALVAHRIGGCGTVTVEIEAGRGMVSHRLWGSGEPKPIQASDAVVRFRKLVECNGGVVHHDDLGPHGTGLTFRLPSAS